MYRFDKIAIPEVEDEKIALTSKLLLFSVSLQQYTNSLQQEEKTMYVHCHFLVLYVT